MRIYGFFLVKTTTAITAATGTAITRSPITATTANSASPMDPIAGSYLCQRVRTNVASVQIDFAP